MSTPVDEQEASIRFVMDEISSPENAGGCTQAWWDTECPDGTEAEYAAAMAKLMDVDTGAPISGGTLVVYTAVGNTLAQAGIHVGVEVGMVAYVQIDPPGFPDVDEGAYKVTAVGVDEITCAGIDGADCTVLVAVGGANAELQEAFDRAPATNYNSVIYVQSHPAATFLHPTPGNSAKNTFVRVVGFNTVPGDMDRGGAYYESPFEILQNGSIDPTKTVSLSTGGAAVPVLSVPNLSVNVIFENFHLSDSGASTAAVEFTGTPKNIVFRNCRFSDGARVMGTTADALLMDSCFAKDIVNQHYNITGDNNILMHCVSEVSATKTFAIAVGVEDCRVIGCLAVGGARGVRVFTKDVTVLGNTFYGQTWCGVDLSDAGRAIVLNNIFDLAPGATGLYAVTAGSFINDYNCFIETDGTPLTIGVHGAGTAPVLGPHSIEVDPLFVDADANNFRLMSNSLCRRTGKPTVGAT